MVDSMKQIFLLKPEVLTPNRNGFMAKKRKWHLKAGSTVLVCVIFQDNLLVLIICVVVSILTVSRLVIDFILIVVNNTVHMLFLFVFSSVPILYE